MNISLERRWTDDDGMLEVAIRVSNGQQTSTMRVYVYPSELESFGAELRRFPSSPSHEVTLESGSREPRWYGHFRMRVFVRRYTRCTVEISTFVPAEAPDGFEARFYAEVEAAELNELGRQVESWARSDRRGLEFPAASDG